MSSRRVLGLDYGKARTGLAVSDPSGTIVRPLPHLQRANTDKGLAQLRSIVIEHDVSVIVVGLPVGPNGDTRQTAQCRSFAARIQHEFGTLVSVELHDERFTSLMADQTRAVTGTDSSRDSLAASHLLESWLRTRNP